VLDSDDQIRLLKQLLEAENIDEKRWPARLLAAMIDGWKNRGLRPERVPEGESFAFANGKYYRVIAKNSPGPAYQLRIKAKGRGVLNGQFMLDNMPIGLFQMLLQENQAGQLPGSQMAPLPVIDLGLHEVTVKFNNYSFNKKIPIIKYFVSLAGMIQIVSPLMDSKLPAGGPIELRWAIEKNNPIFEIAVSTIPFQFLNDKQIEWRPAGGSGSFTFDTGAIKAGSWIYWQVRLLNESKQVQTTSEIAAFKLSEQ